MKMLSDDFVDSTIANLKVIGMVPRNGRLCVRKGQLCLESEDQLQPMRRWARGDSRDLTMMHVWNTIHSAQRIIQHLVENQVQPAHLVAGRGSDVVPIRNNDNDPTQWVLNQILTELGQCEIGLQNLRTTYATDSMMVASVGVLIERIASYRVNQMARPDGA